HYSTDYVFDGGKQAAYVEADVANPLNAYGCSKLAGESAVQAVGGRFLIFRTSWVYGLRGNNFLRTILRLAETQEALRIVDDQLGAPTWSRMIAEATAQAVVHPGSPLGLFHLACGGAVSWHGFTQAILELTLSQRTRQPALSAILSSEYPQKAVRPRNSTLACERLAEQAGLRLPDWLDTLKLCLAH
ncbi:MAG: sugar nucleotide-binding protein, partial [Proteobacteria bacterium]|nr:sugar nucleotide-binding protein [Pseudomonadota bacterium]